MEPSKTQENPTTARWPKTGLALALAAAFVFAGCAALPKKQDDAGPLDGGNPGTDDDPGIDTPQGGGTAIGGNPYTGDQPMVGAWLSSWPTDETPLIDDFQRRTGARLDMTDVFIDWYTPVKNVSHTLIHISSRGTMPILTWEPHGFTTADIADGTAPITLRNGRTMALSRYIDEFSNGVCKIADQTKVPILIRPMHEMNGDWYTWGISYQAADGTFPNTNDSYKAAWKRIYDAFEARCGEHIRFVWAVNHFSVGVDSSLLGTYPGDDMVDYVGIDGYNWGSKGWGWHDFDTIFADSLCVLHEANTKPILISEIGSSEEGGDKADWIEDMYARILETPRIKGFVWLDHAKFEVEINGPMDWNVDSSPESLAAFAKGAKYMQNLRTGGENEFAPWPPC